MKFRNLLLVCVFLCSFSAESAWQVEQTWDLSELVPIDRSHVGQLSEVQIAVSQNGKTLAVQYTENSNHRISLVDLESGYVRTLVPPRPQDYFHGRVTFTPNGGQWEKSLLLFQVGISSEDIDQYDTGQLVLYDADQDSVEWIKDLYTSAYTFTHDGQYLLEETTYDFELRNVSDGEVVREIAIREPSGPWGGYPSSLSPDQKFVAYNAGDLVVRDTNNNREWRKLCNGCGSSSISFLPNGKLFVYEDQTLPRYGGWSRLTIYDNPNFTGGKEVEFLSSYNKYLSDRLPIYDATESLRRELIGNTQLAAISTNSSRAEQFESKAIVMDFSAGTITELANLNEEFNAIITANWNKGEVYLLVLDKTATGGGPTGKLELRRYKKALSPIGAGSE